MRLTGFTTLSTAAPIAVNRVEGAGGGLTDLESTVKKR